VAEVPAARPGGEPDLHAKIARLNRIIQALMNRAERSTETHGSDFSLFQTAGCPKRR